MIDVFVRCARSEEDWADALVDAIQSRGWSAKWDDSFASGHYAAQQAKAVIVIWSERSVASSCLLADAVLALGRGALIAARADAAPLPRPFVDVPAFDLNSWLDGESLPAALREAIAARLAGTPDASGTEIERRRSAPIAERARQFEAMAWDAGVRLVLMAPQLMALDAADLSPQRMTALASDGAKAYHDLHADLDRITPDTVEVEAIRGYAASLLAGGDVDAAHANIDNVLAGLRLGRGSRPTAVGALLLDRARLNEMRLRYADAIADCEAAIGLAPRALEVLVDLLHRRGRAAEDNEALLRALELSRQHKLPLRQRCEVLSCLGRSAGGDGSARLEAALGALRAALDEYSRWRAPEEWARLHIGVADVLAGLEVGDGAIWQVEEAASQYTLAIEGMPRGRAPHDWAVAQTNLGNVLTRLGEWHYDVRRLESAVEAYRAVLGVWRREVAPLDWARVQNNLSGTLRLLGVRASDVQRQDEAIGAARAALEEWTRERVPLDWAAAQDSLGLALFDADRLEDAVTAFRAALEVFTPQQAPDEHEEVRRHLERAQAEIGARRGV
jgi:tetratricopeptide (TPR) repeat protein